jgi:hypothetical protein
MLLKDVLLAALRIIIFTAGFLLPVLIVLMALTAFAGTKEPDVGLLLARSCVGEAGFKAIGTGECAAIMHIYKKRAPEPTKSSLYWTARQYSSAVKYLRNHPNRWVLQLNRRMIRPRSWDRRLSWKNHIPHWKKALNLADNFLAGEVPDPVPQAMHYGGHMDRHRLSPRVWKRIRGLKYENTFYELR